MAHKSSRKPFRSISRGRAPTQGRSTHHAESILPQVQLSDVKRKIEDSLAAESRNLFEATESAGGRLQSLDAFVSLLAPIRRSSSRRGQGPWIALRVAVCHFRRRQRREFVSRHPDLHPGSSARAQRSLQKAFEAVRAAAKPPPPVETIDAKRRNRHETRAVTVFDAKKAVAKTQWRPHAAAIIRVERSVDAYQPSTGPWKPSTEKSYHLSSYKVDAQTAARAIRGHWAIANELHSTRDVTLREDASRIRANPGIFARVRNWAYDILRRNQSDSLPRDQYAAALDGLKPILEMVLGKERRTAPFGSFTAACPPPRGRSSTRSARPVPPHGAPAGTRVARATAPTVRSRSSASETLG